MKYSEMRRNLALVIRSVGVAEPEQLEYFFSDAPEIYYFKHHLQKLIDNRICDYDEKTNQVTWHSADKLSPFEAKRYIKAFWVAVQFKSSNIRDIMGLSGITKLMFLSNDDSVYDVAVVESAGDALTAAHHRNIGFTLDKEEAANVYKDEVNHIAVVDNVKLGKQMGKYGFDSYCILNEDGKPTYTPLA